MAWLGMAGPGAEGHGNARLGKGSTRSAAEHRGVTGNHF